MSAATYSQTTAATSGMVKLLPLNPPNISIGVAITGGTATVTVQYSFDNPANATDTLGTGMTWFNHAVLASITATTPGTISFPVSAVRTVVSAISGATVTTTVLEAGA